MKKLQGCWTVTVDCLAPGPLSAEFHYVLQAMEMLGGMCEPGVVQRHLFNNTPDERTVYATLKPTA